MNKKVTTSILISILFSFFLNKTFAQCSSSFCSTPVFADSPQAACVLCDLAALDGYLGTTEGFSPNITPGPFCGSVENNQFIGFIAPQESISFIIEAFNCVGTPMGTGVQAEIYQTNDCVNQFISVSNCASPGNSLPFTVNAENLTIGETYYLMIDGWASDICEFTIEISGSINGNDELPFGNITVDGPTCIATDSTIINFSFPSDNDTFTYEWTLQGGTILSGMGTADITASFSTIGAKTVCVAIGGECGDYPPLCLDIDITEIYETNETVIICNDTTEVICGGQVIDPIPSADTTFQFQFVATNGCDSLVFCHLEFVNIDTNFIDVSVCSSDNYSFCDSIISEPGIYTAVCNSYQGCDSIIVANIQFFESYSEVLNIEICQGDSYEFADSTFSEQGVYYFNYSSVDGCDSSITIALSHSMIVTNLLEEICPDEVFVIGDSMYSETGFYTQTLESFTGCDSVVNLNLIILPGLTLVNTIIQPVNGQNLGLIALEFSTFAFPLSFEWSNGETSQNITDLDAGLYQLTVTDDNGCQFEYEFLVEIQMNTANLQLKQAVEILPNPIVSGNYLQISNQHTGLQDLTIEIRDMAGRNISTTVCSFTQNICQVKMPKTAGTYLIKVATEEAFFIEKVVVY